MEREQHQRELAARANFFKRQLVTGANALAGPIIAAVEGNPAKRRDLVFLLRDYWEDTMDAWVGQRSFVLDEENSNGQEGEENEN